MNLTVPEALQEMAEELKYLNRLLDEAESKMRCPKTPPELRFHLHNNYYAWMGSYKNTLIALFDLCQQINQKSKGLTNLRHIQVYQAERQALRELRALHLRTT